LIWSLLMIGKSRFEWCLQYHLMASGIRPSKPLYSKSEREDSTCSLYLEDYMWPGYSGYS